MCRFSGIGISTAAQRYHIANGCTSLVHRQDYGITSVPVRYTLRPQQTESRRSITGSTGALPTLTKSYRSTAAVVPLLAPAAASATKLARHATVEIFEHVENVCCSATGASNGTTTAIQRQYNGSTTAVQRCGFNVLRYGVATICTVRTGTEMISFGDLHP